MHRIAAFVYRLLAGAVVLFSAGLCNHASATDYAVSGQIDNLIGDNLRLRLTTVATCLADNVTFSIQSTDTNDCFTPANTGKCCSNSIKATSYNGISTVTCTCGVIIIPILPMQEDAPDTSQTIVIPRGSTAFSFPQAVPDISNYAVLIDSQPVDPPLSCHLTHSTGTINGQAVNNVFVDCTDRIFAYGFETN